MVDDNHADLELARETFAEYRTVAQLDTRTTARDALGRLEARPRTLPDVVVVDVNMPIMTGLDLLEVLKSRPHLQHLPVVMLSTSAEPQTVHAACARHASADLVHARTFPAFVHQVDQFIAYWRGCCLPDRQGPAGLV